MKRGSLQLRVLVLVLCAAVVGIFGAYFVGFQRALGEADELFDAQLIRSAQVLLAVNGPLERGPHHHRDEHGRRDDGDHHKYELSERYRVWWREGEGDQARWVLRYESDGLPHLPELEELRLGFADRLIGDQEYRLLLRRNSDDSRRVAVAQLASARQHVAGRVANYSLRPLLLSLPLWLVALGWLIHRGLRPLRTLALELAARDAARLDPVQLTDPPTELQPVVGALNNLLGRMGDALRHERRFTDQAAHELRTPLAALAAQLQVAQRAAQRTPDEVATLQRALQQARLGANRMAHLVDQMLALARIEAAEAGFGESDLVTLAEEVCAELGSDALENGLQLRLNAPDRLTVWMQRDWMSILLRNLLDNALRYTPAGGEVEVSLTPLPGEGRVRLTVRDSGPGVAADQLHRLGQRFERFGARAEGVGLGLSIVRRVAELHQGVLHFTTGLKGPGLGVQLDLPLGKGNGA